MHPIRLTALALTLAALGNAASAQNITLTLPNLDFSTLQTNVEKDCLVDAVTGACDLPK